MMLAALLISKTCFTNVQAQPLESDEAINIRIYETARASVVNITNVVIDYDLFFQPYASESSGSGIVLDTAGRILTNHHVIANASQLEVTLEDGSKWSATLIGSDPTTDVAVLKISAPPTRLHPVRMGD
jgi:putative serine protease PepD